jgi:transposase
VLREYYPTFLDAFAAATHTNLAKPEARAVLAIAPTPAQGAKLSKSRIVAALRRAGRQRQLEETTTRIQHALRRPQLRQCDIVEQPMGGQAVALLATLVTECANVDELLAASTEAFGQHPDYHILTSFPGLSDVTGARLLAEIGDDPQRFTDPRGLKAFAGAAPITRASGRSISITHRRVKNNRLAAVGFVWAFAAIPRPGPAKDHYDRRRAHGDRHAAALRHLYNRFLGQLWHCLQTRQTYDEHKAWNLTAGAQQSDAA